MDSAPHNISAITDISANIFAVLILILVAVVAVRERSPLHDATPQEIDVVKDVASIERSPLGSDQLFDLLYERGNGVPSIKIDLFDDRIDAVVGTKTERFDSVEKAVLRIAQFVAASDRLPVAVYVFDHRFYRRVTDALKSAGWVWRELSVPQALRESAPETKGQSWSRGFQQLIVRPSDRTLFRTEIARLLQSGSVDTPFVAGSSEGSRLQSPETIIERLVQWWRSLLQALTIVIGLFFVAWVEIARPRDQ